MGDASRLAWSSGTWGERGVEIDAGQSSLTGRVAADRAVMESADLPTNAPPNAPRRILTQILTPNKDYDTVEVAE